MKKIFSFLFLLSFSLCQESIAQQLVMRGDYPDPSVVKIGNTYWASATTSNWAPGYPLLKSTDLVNWQNAGYVFPKLPDWADFYLWAPEITYENGRVYIYYAAHKKGGNLCVGIASADRPEGPYRDHGPIICQEVGSIDAFPMRDEAGKLHMVWKEDANSVNKPTPIWIQELNEERTALVGPKKELFRNTEAWEANLVEGVSMVRRGDYFYAFYAAAGCCGAGCTYQTGVARSRSLHGPWEKYAKNPVLGNEEEWICPGHGTPIEKDGRHYFLYHAYDKSTNIFTGRQGLLIEYRFTPDGWIEFIRDRGAAADVPIPQVKEYFRKSLSPDWQWSVFRKPEFHRPFGKLKIDGSGEGGGAYLGHKTYTGNYTVNALVMARRSSAMPGLALIGDDKNMVVLYLDDDKLRVVEWRDGKEKEIASRDVNAGRKILLRMEVRNGKDISFSSSTDGTNFALVNPHPVDGAFLPPWDRALRAGLVARGSGTASFDSFDIESR